MSEKTLKKRYLLHNAKEAIALLAMASSSIKKHISSIFLDTNSASGVIVFLFETLEESIACETALSKYIEKDVSGDKRYKKRYLEFFGLPEHYDFELDEVFLRLDKLGAHAFGFSFHAGSSTQKVLKVLLYHSVVELEQNIQTLFASEDFSRKSIQKNIEQILGVLHLCQYVFDAKTIKRMKERFEVLLSIFEEEDLETIKALIKTENYRLMFFDLGYLMLEESLFFATEDMPILFFVRKRMKKEKSKLLKLLKKSLYM